MPISPENKKRYPSNWDAIRAAVLERAEVWIPGSEGFVARCECVGECARGTHAGRCPNLQGGIAYGTGSHVVLTVAHLDHVPEHCELSNLRAMCNGCHLHYDRDHHAQSRQSNLRAARADAGQLELGGTE
jgi:5-methylcytosine-specific restriction endonuclease McrA